MRMVRCINGRAIVDHATNDDDSAGVLKGGHNVVVQDEGQWWAGAPRLCVKLKHPYMAARGWIAADEPHFPANTHARTLLKPCWRGRKALPARIVGFARQNTAPGGFPERKDGAREKHQHISGSGAGWPGCGMVFKPTWSHHFWESGSLFRVLKPYFFGLI